LVVVAADAHQVAVVRRSRHFQLMVH